MLTYHYWEIYFYICWYFFGFIHISFASNRTYFSVFSNFVLRNGVSMELMRFPLENTHSTWVRWMAGLPGVRGGPVSKFLFFFFAGECISGARVVRVKGFGQQQRWTTRFYWSDVMRMSRGGWMRNDGNLQYNLKKDSIGVRSRNVPPPLRALLYNFY